MKIEMDDNSVWFGICFGVTVSIAVSICFIGFLVYHYNALAWKNGYVQKQMEASQQYVWTLPERTSP